MSTATSETQTVFQSKWGFHPCDYQTFRKLKEIHKYYWMALRRHHEWERWNRKEPQNRILRRWIKDESGRKVAFEVVGPRPEPKTCPHFRFGWSPNRNNLGEKMREAYQEARYPRAKENVVPLRVTPQEIDEFLAKCREWVNS